MTTFWVIITGEDYGTPLQYSCLQIQCSCLENPRDGGACWDGGAWWAAVYRVAQSRTRLKRLGSSSNSF